MYKAKDKSRKVLRDEDGKVVNENQSVKLIRDTPSYWNYLKTAKQEGFARVEVERVFTEVEKGPKKGTFSEEKTVPQVIIDEILDSLKVKKEFTEREKIDAAKDAEIQDLKDKVAKLTEMAVKNGSVD